MRNFRKAIATLSVVAILSSLVVSTAFAGTFGDVPADAYYYNAVETLASEGIIDASKTSFDPARQLQRQEAAKLIVESAGLVADLPEVASFTDVPKTLWSFASVETAKANGVVNGYTDANGALTGKFGPTDTVTRAQFAKMIVEAFDLPMFTPDSPTFPDVTDTNAWYYEYVETAAHHGVVKGFADGSFGANKQIVRQDGAVMIYRALGMEVNPDDDDTPPPAGDIDISLGDTPASSVVPINATRVPYLTMDVDGEGTIQTMTFERFGAGAPADFDAVYLYEGDKRLTTGRTVNTSTHRVTFTGLNLMVDGMSELSVVADMDGPAPGGLAKSGNVNGFRLYEVTSNDNVSFGDVEGELMSISAATVGKITITKGANPSNPKLGETEAKIAEFKLDAGATEAVDVYGITLYQAGGISSTNLSNFVLKQNGVEVATAEAVESNDTIVLTFDSPFSLAKGDSRNFELYADIGQGAKPSATETIKIYLENRTDLNTVGSVYGFGVEVDNTMYNGTGDDDATPPVPAIDYSEVTVEGGQVTISFQGPSIQDYAVNTKDVELMRFNIISQNNVEIRKTNLTVTTTGTNLNDIQNIELYDVDSGSLLVGPWESPTVGAGSDSETLSDVWTLEAGEARTLAFRADIANTAAVGTVKIQLDAFNGADIRNLDNNTNVAVADIVPSSAVVGNTHNLLNATTTISKAGVPATQTFINGSSSLPMTGIIVSAGSGKDVKVRSLKVTADGLGSCTSETDCVLSLTLWDGSTQLSTTRSLSGTTATFSNIDLNIAKGTSKTLVVKANLNTLSRISTANTAPLTGVTTFTNGNTAVTGAGTLFTTELAVGDYIYRTVDGNTVAAKVASITNNTTLTLASAYTGTTGAGISVSTSTLAIDVAANTDITLQDADGNTVTAAGTVAGNDHTILDAGTLSVEKAANESGVTDSRIVVAGTNGVVLAKYTFRAQNEALKLSKVPVSIGGATQEVKALYLYDGSTKVAGPVSPDGTGLAHFNSFTTDFVVPKNDEKTLSVVADLSTIDEGARSSTQITAVLDNDTPVLVAGKTFEARSAGGSNTVVTTASAGSGDTPGNDLLLRKSSLTINRVALTDTNIVGDSELYKFTVEVTPGQTAALKQVSFNVVNSVAGGTIDTFRLFKDGLLVGDDVAKTTITNGSIGPGPVASTLVTISFNQAAPELQELLISGTSTFSLRANVDTAASNDSITTTMAYDTVAAFIPENVSDLLGVVVLSGSTGNLIWSDRSSNSHNAVSGASSWDWGNSAYLKNFPIGGQTLIRP